MVDSKKSMGKWIALVFLSLVIFTGCSKSVDVDEGIQGSYNLPENHVMVKVSADEIFQAAERGESFILYLGFPECPWCQVLTPTLNEVATEKQITEIWYWNPKEYRGDPAKGKEHHEDYLRMLDLIGLERPPKDEKGVNGISRVSVPFVAVINDGKADTFDTPPATLGKGKLMRDVSGKETTVIEEIRYQDGWIVNGEGEFVTAYMWDDLVTGYQVPEGYEDKVQWLSIEEFEPVRKEALSKLLNTSKCASCL